MATSPGPRGGSSVLEIAKTVFLFKALTSKEASHYSFNDNFDTKNGITNKELNKQLLEIIKSIDL
jgi:hypothetical protein